MGVRMSIEAIYCQPHARRNSRGTKPIPTRCAASPLIAPTRRRRGIRPISPPAKGFVYLKPGQPKSLGSAGRDHAESLPCCLYPGADLPTARQTGERRQPIHRQTFVDAVKTQAACTVWAIEALGGQRLFRIEARLCIDLIGQHRCQNTL